MDSDFTNWWSELLRWLITTLVFGIYIALTFFSLRGNGEFLTDFEYYLTTISATSLAWFLRYLWSTKGLEMRLSRSKDIKDKETGKSDLVSKINNNYLTDVLETKIDKTNKEEKLKQYKNKCEKKYKSCKQSKFFKWRASYWKEERESCDREDFNIDVVRVKYYKYDIDGMLSSSYKPTSTTETRGNMNKTILTSYRTNIVTLVSFAILGGLQVFLGSYSSEDLFVLIGRLFVFTMNIYNGLRLGISFVDSDYSRDLSKDYVFLKTVLKENGITD